MNKTLSYLLPVILLIASFGISTMIDNQLVLFIGWIVFLIWTNIVAAKFQNKLTKISTLVLLIITILWGIGVFFWASAF